MNKILWLFLILIASLLFLVSIFTRDINFSLISLILVLILDKYKPLRVDSKKYKNKYYYENNER